MQWQGPYDEANNRPTTIELGPSVKLMQCKYNCGGQIVVTTMTRNPPHHFQCGIKAAVECSMQMRAKRGPYYDRYLAAMAVSHPRWVAGMRNWIHSIDYP